MAKLLKHLLGKKSPPQPPEPDYDAENGGRSSSWEFETDEDALPDYTDPVTTLSSTCASRSAPTQQQQTHNLRPRPHSYASGGGSSSPLFRNNDVGAKFRPSKESPAKLKKPVILEDYSDPADVRKAAAEDARRFDVVTDGAQTGNIYDEGDYTEPYEAQKILQQIREAELEKEALEKRKGELIPAKKKVHVYEDPYDPEDGEAIVAKQLPSDVIKPSLNQDKQFVKPQNEQNEQANHSHLQTRRSQSHELDSRPPEEYDEPWEWGAKNRISQAILEKREEIALSSSGSSLPDEQINGQSSASHLHGNQTREKDVRPQEDYEIPWEYKPKDRLSHVLMGDAELESPKRMESPKKFTIDYSKMSEPIQCPQSPKTLENMKTTDSPRQSPKKTGLKLDIKPRIETLGETIDPSIPLEEQKWYHGKLSRHEAESILRIYDDWSFLVRQSESGSAKDYSLSLKSARGFMHMKIVRHKEGYILGEFSKPFHMIPDIIDHYSKNKLNIKGAEHMRLLHPITSQLL